MSAQIDEFCATPFNTEDDPSIYSGSTDKSIMNTMDPVVINIFFWQVRDINGGYDGINFEQNKLLESVALLNHVFNESKIFFKYRGFDKFNSPPNIPLFLREEVQVNTDINGDGVIDANDVVLECVDQNQIDVEGYGNLGRCEILGAGLPSSFKFFNYVENNGYVNENALNIYVPYKNNGGFGGAASGSRKNTARYDRLLSYSFVHEVAHNLGLNHTRSSSENVTREPFLNNGDVNEDFNALDVADRLVGTAANPGFWKYDPTGQDFYPDIDNNCNYIGDAEDSTGTEYVLDYYDLVNCMSNAYECMESEFVNNDRSVIFTDDQRIKMLEKASSNSFSSMRTSLEALYEPYAGGYFVNNPTSPLNKNYFQPGFDYTFVRCYGAYPQPAPYNDNFAFNAGIVISSIDKDVPISQYQFINHPNRSAISIHQVEVAQGYARPQKCYNNNNKSAISGKITRFNDNYFNTNVTITLKDSTSINNNNLIESLENGLYSIEKQFDDGTVEGTVVQKTGN